MELTGKRVCAGIAIGKIAVYHKSAPAVTRREIKDTDGELLRLEKACVRAEEELQELHDMALKQVGEQQAAIFEVHQMLLQDESFLQSITGRIRGEKENAEYAVTRIGEAFAAMFAGMEDETMRARAADIRDVSNRLVRILGGREEETMNFAEPVILLADDLTPGETVQLDKSRILSFVTRQGSFYSHTAILARTLNIPALTGVDFPEDAEGKTAIVDAAEGKILIDPEVSVLCAYQEKQKKADAQKHLLRELKGKENITLDGKKIDLYANIGGVSDVADVLASDAGGIGLFRSEFLYLGRDQYPGEEDQFHAYRTVAESMAGKKVIIRTIDIGADKQADYFRLDKENNPAMGYRGIRISLDRQDIFKTQLRALYRAGCYGNIAIMFPMIISVTEVRQIKKIIEEVQEELDKENLPFKKDVEIGIMIETPAAVMISDELAKEVDFFSVGTNDLTQYTLAIDRQNPKLDNLYDPHHPAIMRMLQMVVDNGHKGGCKVGICGELAADTTLTETLLKMGFDELSVSPSMVLRVRDQIRKTDTGR